MSRVIVSNRSESFLDAADEQRCRERQMQPKLYKLGLTAWRNDQRHLCGPSSHHRRIVRCKSDYEKKIEKMQPDFRTGSLHQNNNKFDKGEEVMTNLCLRTVKISDVAFRVGGYVGGLIDIIIENLLFLNSSEMFFSPSLQRVYAAFPFSIAKSLTMRWPNQTQLL